MDLFLLFKKGNIKSRLLSHPHKQTEKLLLSCRKCMFQLSLRSPFHSVCIFMAVRVLLLRNHFSLFEKSETEQILKVNKKGEYEHVVCSQMILLETL